MQSSSNIHGKFNTADVHAVCAVAKISGAGVMGDGHGERSFMSRGHRNVTILLCLSGSDGFGCGDGYGWVLAMISVQ